MVQHVDRRQPNRLTDPSCPRCFAPPDRVKAFSRTDATISFKCQTCEHTWSLPKPNPGPGGLMDPRPHRRSATAKNFPGHPG